MAIIEIGRNNMALLTVSVRPIRRTYGHVSMKSSAELETLINFHWFRSGAEFELKTPPTTKSTAS